MNVIIYSTPTCPYCILLKNFLNENKIEFIEKDISANKENLDEAVKKSGQASVPIVDINGEIIIGFNQEKISELLGIK